jgi:hypothetical protein
MNPPFHPPSVCPFANLFPFHLPHTETHQWGPHPSSVFHEISALPGALISHWGTRFCICTSFPNLFIIYCTNALFSVIYCCHRWRPAFLLATCNPCHPWLEHYFSFPLAGIIYIFRVLPRSLPIPSKFVHLVLPLAQLILGLGVPLTLDLVTRLQPLFVSYILQPRAVLSLPTS